LKGTFAAYGHNAFGGLYTVMLSVNTNINAVKARAYADLLKVRQQITMRQISSGQRVETAADDAAGLAVANKLASQIRSMNTALKNTSDGISLVQQALSGMQTSVSAAMRLRELAVQSHNGIYTDTDRQTLQQEAVQILGTMDQLSLHTKFNDIPLLDGSFERDMRVGPADSEMVNIQIDGIGVSTQINGASNAFGISEKILRLTSTAQPATDLPEPITSTASGIMRPDFTAPARAVYLSGSQTAPPAASTAASQPAYLAESRAGGTSFNFNLPSSAASGTAASVYRPATQAFVQSTSLSTPSVFTAQGFANPQFNYNGHTERAGTSGTVIELDGWDVHLERIELDGDDFRIDGFQVPVDQTEPSRARERSFVPDAPPSQQGDTLEARLANTARGVHWDVVNNSLMLLQGNIAGYPYSVTRGPYVVSQDAAILEAGDSVSFEWFGHAGGDAFDVYGFLLNVDDGSTINLLDATGPRGTNNGSGRSTLQLKNDNHTWLDGYQVSDDGWITASASVAASGRYKFVFIGGSYDATGGRIHGNGLSVRSIDIQRTNGLGANEFTAAVTVQAEEAEEVQIDAALLASAAGSAGADPGGVFSLLSTGEDESLFTINPATGDIRSTGPLRHTNQDSYNFTVRYAGPGGLRHDEAVTLNLTPHQRSSSVLTATESDLVSVPASLFSGLQSFAAFEAALPNPQPLTYSLESYDDDDGNPGNDRAADDYLRFIIDPVSGDVQSAGPLDYALQPSYGFNIRATAADGRSFVNSVTLNLADTLNARAALSAEAAERIALDISDLTASADFHNRHPSGIFSLSGRDASAFSVSGSEIVTNETFTHTGRQTLQFDLVCTAGTQQHTEHVSISLTQPLQSDTQLTAPEGTALKLSRTLFSNLNAFAMADNYQGRYLLAAYDNNDDTDPANKRHRSDFRHFDVSSTGLVSTSSGLNFEDQEHYRFNLRYEASDGRIFTDRVTLDLQDRRNAHTRLSVPEADTVAVALSDLPHSTAYASANPGGRYSISRGRDIFSVQGDQIIAHYPLRKAVASAHQFQLVYSHDGTRHTEDITLHLTESRQSRGALYATEADIVTVRRETLRHLDEFVSLYPGGRFSLSGADSQLFDIDEFGTVTSASALSFAEQEQYSLNVHYMADREQGFTSQMTLSLSERPLATKHLVAEEAHQVVLMSSQFSKLQAYMERDSFAGQLVLLDRGDGNKFTLNDDGSITSDDVLRHDQQQHLSFMLQYNARHADSFIQRIELALSPSTLNQSRTDYFATEAGKIIIDPHINPYLYAYAHADNFSGRFSFSPSAADDTDDTSLFHVDDRGVITTTRKIDFETDRKDYAATLHYHHSNGVDDFTDFITLSVSDDIRDNGNLALDSIDISTRKGAEEAVTILDSALLRLTEAQAKLGAVQNRFNHKMTFLSGGLLNVSTAKSRIVDADFAAQSAKMARLSILESAVSDMLMKSNEQKKMVLDLLEVM